MSRHNLLRFEELETRQMLSADVPVDASPILRDLVSQRDSLFATIISPVPTPRGANEEAEGIMSRRVREGVNEAVETLMPASIDLVLSRLADDPIDLVSALQSPKEWRLSFEAGPDDIDSLGTRFSRLSEIFADRGEMNFIPEEVRSSIQEAITVAWSRVIGSLRELHSRYEMSTQLVVTKEATTVPLTNNVHDTFEEQPRQLRSDRVEHHLVKDFATASQASREFNIQQQGLSLEAQETPEISPTIPHRLGEPAVVANGDSPEQSSMPQQYGPVSIRHWIREKSLTPAENMVHALVQLHVSLGEPFGDFAIMSGLAEFEFDSLIQAEESIADIRAKCLGGLTLLATATIVAGHVNRSRSREKQDANEKLVGEMADARDIDAFDETVHHDKPSLDSWLPS